MAHRSAMNRFALLGLTVMSLAIAGCSSDPKGVRIINGGTSAIPAEPAAPIRELTGPEINKVVLGKTFQFTRKGASGFVIYNTNGTLTVTDDQKGSSTGKWTVTGNQYCETYSPAQPLECGVFKSTGDAFFAANSRLVDLRI